MSYIVRYYFNLTHIYELLEKRDYKTVTFFIDVSSVSRGIYSSKLITPHIFSNNKDIWFNEIVKYIDWLRNKFKKFDPFFILFYDAGVYKYHLSIYPEYKATRSSIGYVTIDKYFSVDLFNAMQVLKKYTYAKLYTELNNKEDIVSIYLKEQEADLIPHYVISKNFLDTKEEKNLNVILSSDKDLLQTTKFGNTIQILTRKKRGAFTTEIYNRRNSLKQLIDKDPMQPYFSDWIPIFLSIAGDKSDNIPGIPKIGYKTLYNKLVKHSITSPDLQDVINELNLTNHEDIINRNFKLVDFETQINYLQDYLRSEIDFLF